MHLHQLHMLARRGHWPRDSDIVRIKDLTTAEIENSYAYTTKEFARASQIDRSLWDAIRRIFTAEGNTRGISLVVEPPCTICGDRALYIANGKRYCKLHKHHAVSEQKIEEAKINEDRLRRDLIDRKLTGRRKYRGAI